MKALTGIAIVICIWIASPVQRVEAGSSSAETSVDKQKLRITDLKVTGNRLISTERILHQIQTKPGESLDRERLMVDLQNIEKMGFFEPQSLQIVLERQKGDGVSLTIRVRENPLVSGFRFIGNHAFTSAYLATFFADQVGQPQKLSALQNSIERLEQEYKQKGFPYGRVTGLKESSSGEIEFVICEQLEPPSKNETTHFTVGPAHEYLRESRLFLFSGEPPLGSRFLAPYTVPKN